jgi:hypothetical protein
MTPAEEAGFIALWQQGLETAAIAAQLGIPPGTARSRAYALQQQGKIQPRPKGGKRRRTNTPAPVQRPVQRPVQTIDTGAVPSVDTGAVQNLSADVDRLKGELQGLRQLVQSLIDRLDHPPVQTPVQITALPPYPKGKAVRWNLWILDVIKEQLSTLAAERDLSPSELVQEYLWKALTDQSSSTP